MSKRLLQLTIGARAARPGAQRRALRTSLRAATGIGLVAALLLAGLPSAVLAQTVTPTGAPGVTATPLLTNTPRVTSTPRPTITPTTAPLVATVTLAPSPTTAPAVTATPIQLPVTGNRSSANTLASVLPVIALLLLAIPALGGLRARRR